MIHDRSQRMTMEDPQGIQATFKLILTYIIYIMNYASDIKHCTPFSPSPKTTPVDHQLKVY